MPDEIPLPVTYNPYKHHLRFLQEKVKTWQERGWQNAEPNILTIGNNLIDLYTGTLTVPEVCGESLAWLKSNNLLSPITYSQWLGTRSWRKIMIADGSEWLFKIGDQPERYVHLHPAKYSLHSVRVRATTLKTVLALLVANKNIRGKTSEILVQVNNVRKEKLGLSPVKSLHPKDSGILRLLDLFQNADKS